MLKDKTWYRTPRGTMEFVMGPTRHYPEWVWTLQGNWYRREDGRFISAHERFETDERGRRQQFIDHLPNKMATGLDLVEEVPGKEDPTK